MRHEHDAAHRIAVGILRIIAPCLRDEEQHEFYREAMLVIVEGIKEYDRRRRMENARLCGRSEDTRLTPKENQP